MNFVLLGDAPDALPLAAAIADDPQDRLAFVVSGGEVAGELLRLAPGARLLDGWEELLRAEEPLAVLVAGRAPQTLEAARHFAEAGHPLLALPSAAGDPSLVYELALIRDASPVVLFPGFVSRFVPDVAEARREIERGSLGKLIYVQVERIAATAPAGPPLLQPPEIDAALLLDIELLRALGGNYSQATALQTGATAQGVTQATLTLAGSGLPDATWIMRKGSQARWSCTIAGERGSLRLESDGSLQEIQRQSADGGSENDAQTHDQSEGKEAIVRRAWGRLLDAFQSAVRGQTVEPTWTELTRVLDTIDAAHRSLARRRTIDLYFEATSERSIFKTQMTAIGCGVLVLTLLLILAIQVITALVDIPPALLRTVRWTAYVLVVGPLLLYLALQLLLPVTRPSAENSQRSDGGDAA